MHKQIHFITTCTYAQYLSLHDCLVDLFTESHMDRKLYGMDELLKQPIESSNQALREKSHVTSKLRQTL